MMIIRPVSSAIRNKGIGRDNAFVGMMPPNQSLGIHAFDKGPPRLKTVDGHDGLHSEEELFVDFFYGLFFQGFDDAVLEFHPADNFISHVVGEKDELLVVLLGVCERYIGIVENAAFIGSVFREEGDSDDAFDGNVIAGENMGLGDFGGDVLHQGFQAFGIAFIRNHHDELVVSGVIQGCRVGDEFL
jgi:hypothetical protein